MSTRSAIGIINRDASVELIYAHWDGYPESPGNGACLLEHYSNEDKVRALLEFGNVSSLCRNISPAPGQKHSYDKPAKDVTVFYGRDRREQDQKSMKFKNIAAAQEWFKKSWCEYLYLWDSKTHVWLYGIIQYPEKMYILSRKRCKLPPLPTKKSAISVKFPEPAKMVMDDEDAYNVDKEARQAYVAALAQRIAALRQYVDSEVNEISKILLQLS